MIEMRYNSIKWVAQGGPAESEETMSTDTILEPVVKRVELGRKQVDDEILIRLVGVFGDAEQGYQASYEEWFISAGGTEPEFFEVLFDTTTYPTADEALADAMPSAVKETVAWMPARAVEQPKPANMLNPSDYEITDGYVGSFGITYKTATDETLTEAIAAAAKRRNQTAEEITTALAEGIKIDWCNSPNYYYDHGTGYIRRKRTATPVELVKCACGHSVPRSQVMSASRGTSCPDCYDRMSN